MRRPGLIIAAAAALMASGCVSLLPETQPNTLYRLAAADIDGSSTGDAPVTVLVDRISAPRGLAGNRVAIQRGEAIAYMAGAAWINPAPQLMESAIFDAFYSEAPLIAPAHAEDGVSANYQLSLELRHFEANYDQGENAAPLVRAAVHGRLINRDTRSLVAARTLSQTARATDNRQGAIVAAFSAAAGAAARDLARWTETAICAGDDAPEACAE